MLEGVSYGWVWKFMNWLPGFLLRRWWSKEALSARIRIDVRPRHSPVQINGGPEITRADIWLELHNNGYFPIELDRMTVELNLAGVTLDFYQLSRIAIPADSRHDLYVHGPIPAGVLSHYARNMKNGSGVSLSVYAEFNSKIHDFPVKVQHLSGIEPRHINIPQS
jgi:hypothetical protein